MNADYDVHTFAVNKPIHTSIPFKMYIRWLHDLRCGFLFVFGKTGRKFCALHIGSIISIMDDEKCMKRVFE